MRTTRYLRFAALGDSTTLGVGDPLPGGGWRGWARLLNDALAGSYDVSFCNLAASGATVACVRRDQLAAAVDHRPDYAALIVGVNDTMRSTWEPAQLRADLVACAEALTSVGATLLTVRFHDHAAVLGLPGVLRRPMANRIALLNGVFDDLHATYGGLRVDLADRVDVAARPLWSVDRLHPSELGHRALAREFATLLCARGLVFEPPALHPAGGCDPTRWRDLSWLLAQGAPWFGRRARDLGPWAVRRALTDVRQRAGR